MPIVGLDYSLGRPNPAQLMGAGYAFACRYVTGQDSDPGKALDAVEARALAGAGLWLVAVWETTATRATEGQSAGRADAAAAAANAAACGMPATRPIYFTVDTDVPPARVLPYFAGLAQVLQPTRIGVYGSAAVVNYLVAHGHAGYGWRTLSTGWSGGADTTHANLVQTRIGRFAGVSIDLNYAVGADYGQWMPGRAPDPPAPAPPVEVAMPYTFDICPRPELGAGSVGGVSFPLGAAHVVQLSGDPGLTGQSSWALRLVLHVDSGPDVLDEHLLKPGDRVVVEFGNLAAHVHAVTVTSTAPLFAAGVVV